MKRLISAALALALLSGTAAYADPYGPGPRSGHHERWDGGYRHHRGNDTGTAIAVGFGLIALTAILASQNRDREPDQDNAYPPPPPPNGQDYRQGDDQGYGPDYGPQDNPDQPPYDGNRPYRQ